MARTYDDPCGLARALDVVGDRWALLVVRELLLGPKRFAQLRRGLPGASQSMLTSRLGEMEETGMIRRRFMGPPTGAWAYELTEQGRDLEPVLVQLARWGSRTPVTSAAELSVDALALAMRTTFTGDADQRIRCQLVLDGDSLIVEVADGEITVRRGVAPGADVTVETTSAAWRGAIFAGESLDAQTAEVRGDDAAAERLIGLFERPAPYPVGG
ncbi:helix-turn-helix domain-containing protein [Actinoplanes sp. NPDC051861]|uniref:helix-turn-helix domain-containing protein n=1 Tax=Actinoplanes sp. NPDC051861 TaxID=3155170 RepID=UPI003412AD27